MIPILFVFLFCISCGAVSAEAPVVPPVTAPERSEETANLYGDHVLFLRPAQALCSGREAAGKEICVMLREMQAAYMRVWGMCTRTNRSIDKLMERVVFSQDLRMRLLQFEHTECLKSSDAQWCGAGP